MSLRLNVTYQGANHSLWKGRHETAKAQRIYQVISCINLKNDTLSNSEKGLVIIGFMSDEGIIRNQGRPGAAQGPNTIRLQLANLPNFSNTPLYDVGNIICINKDLEAAQSDLGNLVNYCHEQGHKTLILGGGHETAWGHYLGLKKSYPSVGIINFDAHFDLRNDDLPSSGTPFLQISEDKKKLGLPFNYLCYGIQKTSNTPLLFEEAKRLNVNYLTAEKIFTSTLKSVETNIENFIDNNKHLYISICMDVFNVAISPGVSAPQPMGLMPWHVMPILDYILKSDKVKSIDIVELSPPFDRDGVTAQLASQLASQVHYSQIKSIQ